MDTLIKVANWVVLKIKKLFQIGGFNTSLCTLLPDSFTAFKKYFDERAHNQAAEYDLIMTIIKLWNLHVFSLIIIVLWVAYLIYSFWIYLLIIGFLCYETHNRYQQHLSAQKAYHNSIMDFHYSRVCDVVFDAVQGLTPFLPIEKVLCSKQLISKERYSSDHNVILMTFNITKSSADTLDHEKLEFATIQFKKLLNDAQDNYDETAPQPVTRIDDGTRLLHLVSIEDKVSYYLVTVAYVLTAETYAYVKSKSQPKHSNPIIVDTSDEDF